MPESFREVLAANPELKRVDFYPLHCAELAPSACWPMVLFLTAAPGSRVPRSMQIRAGYLQFFVVFQTQ